MIILILICKFFVFTILDVDECQKDPMLCTNGVCRNTPGSFECICGEGYVLAKGTTACVGTSSENYLRCRMSVNGSGRCS